MICPVCSSNSYTRWGAANGYAVERCRSCGLGITTPFPEPGTLVAVNQETYPVARRIDAYRSRQQYFEKRYRRQLTDIRKFKAGGRLLDIGCNIGMFLNEAANAGYAVTGVELNRECADYARTNSGHEVYSDYLENIAFPAESFDVVTMYDVLEHIPVMPSMLAEVKRILRPGGLQSGFRTETLKTWEPADDFCVDVMQVRLGNSLPARIARKLIRVSCLAEMLVSLLQPLWWRKQRGALVEAYAVNPADVRTAFHEDSKVAS